jgi:hypothetical protein
MARGGWKVLLNGETYAYHLEQRGSRHLFSRDAWQHLRSYWRWLRKWGLNPERHIVPAPHFRLRPTAISAAQPRRAA